MGRFRLFILPLLLAGLATLFFSLSFSPLSSVERPAKLPDVIDDIYLDFDTLRTDLSDYRWPTDASRTMTSGFAAFRRTHFHAGIDISTGGRTGHRVFASRSGHIARIMVSPVGYGKMLQVRHEDGFTTVYAHLDRFADTIEQYVRRLQYANERYSLDVRPDPDAFPVAQGELIAYTGETGSGPAHLHFEIRDERLNPANPLLCPEFSDIISDTRTPEFEQVSFAPYDRSGRVDGSARALTLAVRSAGKGRYTIPRSVRLSGAIGISSKAFDRVNATWNKGGIYHYEVYLDSILMYESKLDRFSAKLSEQIALHYDWPMVESGEGRFQKLYVEPGNRQPLYSKLPEGGGILETDLYGPGEHQLEIVARDAHGNESRLSATVFFDIPPAFQLARTGDTLMILPPAPEHLSRVTVASRSPDQKRWTTRSFAAEALLTGAGGLRLPIDPDDGKLWRIQATNTLGTLSHPVYICPPGGASSNTSLAIRKEFFRDYVLVTLSSHLPFTERPSLRVQNGESVMFTELTAADERTYTGVVALDRLTTATLRLDARGAVNGTPVEAFDEFAVYPITPEEGGTIVSDDGAFRAEFSSGGVYQTMYCRLEKTASGYALFPQDVLMNAGVTVHMAAPSETDRIGLFAVDARERNMIGKSVSDGRISGRVTKFLQEFVIERDTIPPLLSGLSVRSSKGHLQIRFSVRDRLSGTDPDGFRVTVNGRILIAEYDPEKRRVVFDEPYDLPSGTHELWIEARDRLGNRSTLTRSFTVR